MKKLSLFCLTIFLLSLVPLQAQTNNEEFRAAWVITWEFISGSSSVETNKARIVSILDNLKEANMNAVLWQVRQGGTAYYNSSYEPWGSYAGGSDPGFDPLAFAIEEAHKRGMELHAWFNCFAASSTATGAPAEAHPDWVCRDQSGIAMTESRALSPGMEAVRDYTLNVAMEVVNNYDIDGLHLDYIRWNEYTNSKNSKAIAKENDQIAMLDGMFDEAILEDLEENKSGRYLYDVDHPYSAGVPEGFSSWEGFWRGSVTSFVHALHDSIQLVKPHVRLSPAALGKYNWSGWQGYGSVYQDAALWFNEGYIDQLTPMHYHWTTGSGFVDMLETGYDNWGKNIQAGITAGRLFTAGPGSYILDENGVWDNHGSIVNACRGVSWLDGFQFFSYGSWKGYQYFEEAGNTFFAQKTKIRSNSATAAPTAPAVSLVKNDDLHYDITVTPDGSTSENSWFVVYRSENATIDPAADEIIDIHFGTEAFTVSDSFDGTQNYGGQYYYGATAASRYWVESTSSNSELSDAIPSYAPILLETNISDGDTIANNLELVFEFSKEIDEAVFAAGFSILPEMTGQTVTASSDWTTAGRKFTVSYASNFAFDTEYTVTLSESITDKNGVALDGNGDGTPGDAVVIHFTTFDQDVSGPKIEFSNPAEGQTAVNCYEVITIAFDELVDETTVDASSFVINNGTNVLSPSLVVNTVDDKTVLSIKSRSQMVTDVLTTLTLQNPIADTAGNVIDDLFTLSYYTASEYNSETKVLDKFTDTGDWWDPEGSGTTSGTLDAGTTIAASSKFYVPGMTNSGSLQLNYEWDPEATDYLLRMHDPSGTKFDTTYTLQLYVYGDNSQNQIRVACYEYDASGSTTADIAEVSEWVTIDWLGWKLIEWDLGEPNTTGTWLGNGIMDGAQYRVESVQMTRPDGGAVSGSVYVDEIRIVKKSTGDLPVNYKPELSALPDTTIEQGSKLNIWPNWTDANENETFILSASCDTSAVRFMVKGHTPGSRIYISPLAEYFGETVVTVIVRDLGVGELSDTTTFSLTITPENSIDEEELTARKFTLEQNYPNPFNPTTNIRFTIPEAGKTTLIVYNLLGNEVMTLVNNNLRAGNHEVTLDGSRLASGQYIYRLQSGNKVQTRKMLLIK